ncbi:MAG: (2Fe-2S)-binding protein [Proteobacteria bacterium]|nr:(2Fe-2S)-binding protein [Pseudomonadota bacterium]
MDDPTDASRTPSRRGFLTASGATAALPLAAAARPPPNPAPEKGRPHMDFVLNVNGRDHHLSLDPRVTLLDTLRDHLALTGSKKGCDQGQCGACTVHVDGRRVLSCLTLAATVQGRKVLTIEGLAHGETLHPMQAAFVKHDAFQCGYCTPGQIMSAVACVHEGHAASDPEIREYMSGNLCRCAAYPKIVDAIREAAPAMAERA